MISIMEDYAHIHFYNQKVDGVILYANEVTAEFFGGENVSDFIGLSLIELSNQKSHAEEWILNSEAIVKAQSSRMFIESATKKDGKVQWFRTYRSPLYGLTGKILGVHGLSIPVSERSLIPLTKQQIACLKNLALGYTHKQIARDLGLAQKTVEHYLDAVKLKLNCHSRSDLILQAIERGLVGVF